MFEFFHILRLYLVAFFLLLFLEPLYIQTFPIPCANMFSIPTFDNYSSTWTPFEYLATRISYKREMAKKNSSKHLDS